MTRGLRMMAVAIVAAMAASGCAAGTDPAPVQSAQPAQHGPASKAAKAAPIALKAVKTAFTPSPLHSGGSFTSVKVTITNNTKKNLDVNPLFFAITDTGGTKHDPSSALGEDKHQIGTITLAPGEKATGVVTAEGKFVPKTVAFSEAGMDEVARAAVS